jgi:TonB family protein
MKKKQPKSTRVMIWTVSGAVVLMFLGGAVGAINLLLSDDSGKRKRQVQMVTLLKPPPPPKIKEKPPEPEIKKKEEIIEQQPEEPEPDPMEDMAEDEGPMDDDLGLDADGSAGADGFGLRAKKGGRGLIGGRYSKAGLLRKYAWYTAIIQEDLRKKVNKHLESNGGMPDGTLVAHIRISLDESGQVTNLSLERSSGDNRMDRAVQEALLLSSVSEPPPPGMPRVVQLKISSKG